jgi:hypothetical protein
MMRTGRALGHDFTNDAAVFVPHPTRHLRSWLVFEVGNVNARHIAHEANHVIHHMFKMCGVRKDEENYAYHHGHLVDRLHKFFKKELQ